MLCLDSVSRRAITLRMLESLISSCGSAGAPIGGAAARGRCRGPRFLGRTRRLSGGAGLLRRARLDRALDVDLDDPAMRPAALEPSEVDPGLLGHALGERAREDALAALGAVAALAGTRRRLRVRGRPRLFGSGRGGFRRAGLGRLRLGSGLRRLAVRRLEVLERGGVLAFFQKQRDRRVDRHALGAVGDQDLAERPLLDRLDLHGRLVGLDLGDDVAGGHLIAFLLQPPGKVAFGHGRRQRRHPDLDRQ